VPLTLEPYACRTSLRADWKPGVSLASSTKASNFPRSDPHSSAYATAATNSAIGSCANRRRESNPPSFSVRTEFSFNRSMGSHWVHGLLDDWTRAAGINDGSLFRRVSKAGRIWGEAVTEKLVWHVVKEFAAKIGVSKLAPHDLRRSCARLCRAAGGELEQIQFLLGHVSVQTTERYLGCTQRISSAVNDRIGIEPTP
jgi:hypothetical protein